MEDMEIFDKHEKLRINYLLIRELYKLVCIHNHANNMSDFYVYLLADSLEKIGDRKDSFQRCGNNFRKFLETGYGNMTGASKKLIDVGIPEKYFEDELFDMNEEIEEIVTKFAENNKDWKKLLNELPELLEKYYEDITVECGKDCSIPVIVFMSILDRRIYSFVGNNTEESIYKLISGKEDEDLIRAIIFERYKDTLAETEKNEEEQREIADIIIKSQIHKNMGSKEIAGLYRKIIKFNDIDSGYIDKAKTTGTKNVYRNTKPNEAVRYNYFIIREVYKLLSDIDGINHPMDKFYDYLEIKKQDYDEIIETGIADNKHFYNKLSQFLFPASMFRGDNPVVIKMSMTLRKKIKDYFDIKNMIDFRYSLKFEICYMYHTENYILVFAVARMLETIKHIF